MSLHTTNSYYYLSDLANLGRLKPSGPSPVTAMPCAIHGLVLAIACIKHEEGGIRRLVGVVGLHSKHRVVQ